MGFFAFKPVMIPQAPSSIRLALESPDPPLQLVETPDNPIPSRPTVMKIETEDGRSLRAARWAPTARRERGTVCILQGRAEFIEKYFETITDLRRRGFAVVAFDWRGQGLSDRAVGDPYKGHVRSFSEYRLDLEAIRANVLEPYMPTPHFGLAHSMGGGIALAEARDGRLPFERLVATTPMIALCLIKSPKVAAATALALRLLGGGTSYVPTGGATSVAKKPFAGNPLTSDSLRYARNAAAAAALGHGAIGDPTVAWMDSAFRLMRRFADPRFPREIRTPTLIVAAGADPICATPAIERFAARLKAGHAIVLPGARHEILMERDEIREEFFAAFDAFIPGTPDAGFGSAVEELEGGVMDAAVAGGAD
jgi:lysophospholipase